MEKDKSKIIHSKDRKLGDEWLEWQGTLKSSVMNASTGKRIFMGVLLLLIVVSGCLGLFTWYMISPRLAQFHSQLPLAIGFLFAGFWGLLCIWFILMVASVWLEKDFFMRLGRKEIPITYFVPVVLRFGLKLGISRDRLSNSFVQISNTLIRTTARKIKPEKLLILLPRCLQKSIIQTILTSSKQWKIPVFTVAGGTKAREIITELKPRAIIGVACERDLLSGIRDVIQKVPVIGIPNIRPQGPCKDTEINIQELESAIQTFIGKDFKFTQ